VRRLRDQKREVLELRASEAHRAYIEALISCEDAFRRASCTYCTCDDVPNVERERLCDEAEAETARRRIAYRDLCDELGYLVTTPNIGLGPEEDCSCRPARRQAAALQQKL
jgi:hypothetical protein